MFYPGHWAAAYVNSLPGEDAEEGLRAFEALAAWAASLPGALFGSSSAEKTEKLVREALAGMNGAFSAAFEISLRFLLLLIRKNAFSHAGRIIDEIKKILDKRNGIVRVLVEYSLPPGDDEFRIKEAIKKRTGACRVDITGRLNPDLIGGYRLRMGDEMIDASIRSQLRKLEAGLASQSFGAAAMPGGGGS